jgi:pyruvate dehydrogenase E2 component (dihydrolipoamide acetyltransferase)
VAKNVLMPQMGYDMDAGTLLRWLKSPGDEVARGEPIAEIETDKVNIEIEAFDSGVLARTLIGEGDTVPVGEIIAIIGEPGEVIEDMPAPQAASANGVEESAEDTPSEAAAVSASAPQAEPERATQPSLMATGAPAGPGERIRASPLVRRLAEEHAIDLAQVGGSGPHGRIVKRDIQPYVDGEIEIPTTLPAAPGPEGAPAPPAEERVVREAPAPVARPPSGELQDLSRIRQTIGRRMQQSFRDAPHIFITMSIDMGKAMELRAQVNAELDDPASEVTVNDLVIKGVAAALRSFPVLNAAYVDDKREMHERIDVNFAVAIEDGLISPFIPDTDHKTLGEIARATKDLARRAREGGLKPEEYAGGTFTISNLGMFGVDHFTAVINPPQAAILAVGAAKMQPVWNAESEDFEPRFMMQVTLAADHRITDGAESALFLRHLKGLLENPMRMIAG